MSESVKVIKQQTASEQNASLREKIREAVKTLEATKNPLTLCTNFKDSMDPLDATAVQVFLLAHEYGMFPAHAENLRKDFGVSGCPVIDAKGRVYAVLDPKGHLVPAALDVKRNLTAFHEQKKHVSNVLVNISTENSVGNKPSTPTIAIPQSRSGRKPSDLEEENQQLRQQIELQKSQIAEARRVAARETQRYDQLLQQMTEDRKKIDLMLDRLLERNEDNKRLQSVLISRQAGRLRMTESYRGVVVQVHSDEATVVYDVDGDILVHVYVRSQFSDGRLPVEGERLELVVHVSEIEADDLNTQKSVVSDATSPRKNLRPVSDEF